MSCWTAKSWPADRCTKARVSLIYICELVIEVQNVRNVSYIQRKLDGEHAVNLVYT
jgi:hypothetical protein